MLKHYTLPKRIIDQAMREANAAIERDHAAGIFDEGDPNHPKYNNGINYKHCMGMPYAELMAKQHKPATTDNNTDAHYCVQNEKGERQACVKYPALADVIAARNGTGFTVARVLNRDCKHMVDRP